MLINNRYRVIRSLGEGGFGQAYLAEDTQMPSQRQCVVKQLKPIASSTEIYELVKARFQREAAVLEQLGENHPQIPRLYAYFTENKNFYLVQEWIEGETLESLALPQSESTVHALLTAILPVLEFIHGQGIIHRDIKPGNILLRAGSQQPILIDFGAVKETINTTVAENSASSIVIGTPGYMATEQAAGRPLASSDLYSLALTAVYLLTGVPPQALPSDAQTGEILWQQTVNDVSADLIEVLTKAIQYHPRDRYTSAREMLASLTALPHTHSQLAETVLSTVAIEPLVASQNYAIESTPTEVQLPENDQPENNSGLHEAALSGPETGKSAQPWYRRAIFPGKGFAITPLTLGLIALTAVGTTIASNWMLSQRANNPINNSAKTTIPEATIPTETTIPSETTPTEEKINTPPTATEQTTSPQKGQPQSVDKCFELFAYDPEDNTVNVRDSPDGNIIETLPNLSIVQSEGPTAIQTGWNSISVAETGTQGYIWGELLYRTTYQVSDPEDPTANLRQTANGALITAIANGTEVEFLGTDGSWTQVALSNGQSGYITSSRLSEPNCF